MAVVVAGGGITGLAAARHLAHTGIDVVVVEPDERLGGKLRTSTFAGRPVDEGADAFLIRVPWARDLAERVGLGPALVHPAVREAHVWTGGALRLLPPQVLGVPVDLDAVRASGILSEAGVAELAADLGRDSWWPERPGEDTSIADALGPRLGSEAIDRLIDPLVGGINAGSTAGQSLAAVAPQLDAAHRDARHASMIEACQAQVAAARAAGTDPDAPIFAAPRGGMARLVAAVVADAEATGRVEVRTGMAVVEVQPGPRVVLSSGEEIPADGVVVATPAPAAAAMLAALVPSASAVLAGIGHASTAFIRLSIAQDDLPAAPVGSGVLVPRVEGRTITAVSWTSTKWAELAPDRGDGTVVVRVAVGRDGDPLALDLDDATIIERVLDDLTAIVGLRDAPVAVDVIRWPHAFPQYRPGHLERIAAAEGDLRAAAPTVALAGMALRGVGIPACIRSGTDGATTAAAIGPDGRRVRDSEA